VFSKIDGIGRNLGDHIGKQAYRGVLTGFNDAFVIDTAKREELIRQDARSAELIQPFLLGRNIKRYAPPKATKYLIFARRGTVIDDYPAIRQHLEAYQPQLTPKATGERGKGGGRKPGDYAWYEIQDTVAYYPEFAKPKILYPEFSRKPAFTYTTSTEYINNKGFFIPLTDFYLLGILNSRVIGYHMALCGSKLRGDYIEFRWVTLRNVPIPDAPADLRAAISSKVERMLTLQGQLAGMVGLHEGREEIRLQIAAVDRQIDALVYQAFELTDAESAVIEAETQ
jgi:hypothetical protein